MFAFNIPAPFRGTLRQTAGTNAHIGVDNLLTVICKPVSEPRNANVCGYSMLAAAQCGFRWEAGVFT